MPDFFSDTFLFAFLSGVVPALLWLWFWVREDNLHPEPRGRIFMVFFMGMIAVIFVLPFQQLANDFFGGVTDRTIIAWSAIEEFFKLLVAFLFALRTKYMDEPVDALIYMITVALGFSALENALFLFKPLNDGDVIRTVITGNMRFIGASLLHTVSSAVIGLGIALTFYKSRFARRVAAIIGLIVASALHAVFNLFIMESNGSSDTFVIFAYVWGGVIFLLLLFERIKRIRPS